MRTLSGCSYDYRVVAIVEHGRLAFAINPASPRRPSCVRAIDITAETGPSAKWAEGDDADMVKFGTYWSANVRHEDACLNRFPVAYGVMLMGQASRDRGKVAPKRLRRDTVYEVATVTGATGYGQGRFIVHADGRVENLAR